MCFHDVLGDVTSPVRSELHLWALAGHQLRDEGEVWDLRGCPAKLEDDDEGGEINDLGPLSGPVGAGQAGVKNKGERHENTDGSWKADKKLFKTAL